MLVHRRLVDLAGNVAGPIAGCAALGLTSSAAYVAEALLLSGALVAVVERRPDAAIAYLAGALAVIAARAVLLWVREVATVAAGARIRARIRDRLVGKLTELGPAYLSGSRTGRTQTTLVDGVEGLDPYYSRYVPQVIVTALVPVVLVGWLATVEPTAAALLAVAVLFVLTVPRIWDTRLLRTGRARWRAFADLASDYLEAMQGMATLRMFAAVGRTRDRLGGRAHELYAQTMRQLRLSLVRTGASALAVHAGFAAAVIAAAIAVVGGRAGAAQAFLVLLLSVECFRPIRDLSKAWHAGYLGVSAVDGIEELMAQPPTVGAPGTLRRSWQRGAAPAVAFEDVRFTYPGRDEPAVGGVGGVGGLTLRLAAGETVAVVGRSGAGKSTLVNLLLRYHDPDRGRVTLGGVDVRDLAAESLRAAVAVVSQDTYLFHGTVADNLRLARPGATAAELVTAARVAGAHEFIAALPDGYDTALGERANTLSGGQRQRLAIARAVLADAPVLILDEATSQVDGRREAAITAALRRVRAGRTCLVVAHRLSTVRDADRIVVLADGEIAESGRHGELVDADGAYARLVSAQGVGA